jgi:anti-sigma B factor antagonist
MNSIVVMELSGNMIIGDPLAKLRTDIQEALTSGSRQFAFHMGAVEKLDSTGLMTLVDCFTKITDQKGELKFFRVNDRVMDILRITNLLDVFKTFDDEQTALASFNSP